MTKKQSNKNCFYFTALLLSFCLFSNHAQADTETRIYQVSVADLPFNIHGAPSMQQSMDASLDFYYLTHNLIIDSMHSGYLKTIAPRYRPITLILFDTLSVYTPPGAAWLHEEWHRSVLTRRDIDSYNGVYDLDLFSSAIPVRNVLDEELMRLKRDHPAEMVRLHSAGLESEYEMNLEIEKNSFFYHHNPGMQFILLLNHLNNIAYMATCATKYGDETTQDILNTEDEDVSKRDFTGLDCAAWVYDLFRPEEPYEARGTHPSGVGINRYRTLEHLTSEEKNYLRKQVGLSLINLIDPFLFNYDGFELGNWTWNANMRHHLTPFGYNIGLNLFLQNGDFKLLVTGNNYSNHEKTFPGLDIRLYRYPSRLLSRQLYSSIRLNTWLQPQDLLFADTQWSPGGLVSLKLEFPTGWNNIELFFEAGKKTRGWVAGNEFLNSTYNIKTGFSLVFTIDN